MGTHALNGVEGFVSRRDSFFFDPRHLVVEDGFNPRHEIGIDDEDADLLQSIIANGVLVPILVQKIDGRLVIREGHRRHWACLEAIRIGKGHDVKSVPVILIDRKTTGKESLYIALNSSRGKRLNAIEEAEAFGRLIKNGESVDDIATRTGKSKVFVYERLKLLKLTPEVQAALEAGDISIRDAANAAGRSRGDGEKQNNVLTKPKPKPVVVKWNKKEGKIVTKNKAEVSGVDNIVAFLFHSNHLKILEEAGLDPSTIKFSILPKTSEDGSKKGQKQRNLFDE